MTAVAGCRGFSGPCPSAPLDELWPSLGSRSSDPHIVSGIRDLRLSCRDEPMSAASWCSNATTPSGPSTTRSAISTSACCSSEPEQTSSPTMPPRRRSATASKASRSPRSSPTNTIASACSSFCRVRTASPLSMPAARTSTTIRPGSMTRPCRGAACSSDRREPLRAASGVVAAGGCGRRPRAALLLDVRLRRAPCSAQQLGQLGHQGGEPLGGRGESDPAVVGPTSARCRTGRAPGARRPASAIRAPISSRSPERHRLPHRPAGDHRDAPDGAASSTRALPARRGGCGPRSGSSTIGASVPSKSRQTTARCARRRRPRRTGASSRSLAKSMGQPTRPADRGPDAASGEVGGEDHASAGPSTSGRRPGAPARCRGPWTSSSAASLSCAG